ncbi:MAG TPA: hypothetical protein VGK73_32290 [Polyangiaceae bacterium]
MGWHWQNASEGAPASSVDRYADSPVEDEDERDQACKVCGEVGPVASYGWCAGCLAEREEERIEDGEIGGDWW